MDPTTVQPVIDSAGVRYGVMGAVCVLLVIFLWILWRHTVKRDDQIAAERKMMAEAEKDRAVRDVIREKEWEKKLDDVRKECADRSSELSRKYATELSEHVRESRDNEDAIHTRFTGTITSMEQAARASQDKTATMLEKLTDRLLPQNPGPRGGKY